MLYSFVAVAAIDAFLNETGLVTTGLVLHEVQNGTCAISDNILPLSDNYSSGYHNQQKTEQKVQQDYNKDQINTKDSIMTNSGEKFPDQSPEPKNDLKDLSKSSIFIGLMTKSLRGNLSCNRFHVELRIIGCQQYGSFFVYFQNSSSFFKN